MTESNVLIKDDHKGPAAAAEHKVVDPMIKSICKEAKTRKWGACDECP